jgi:hypothetical protein
MTERYAVTAREFPSFDLATMPDVPAHWEETSWHNDACPSFIITDSLGVFVDFADPAMSDFPNWRRDGKMKRFSLCPMRDRQHISSDDADAEGLPENIQTDDWNELLSAAIAETFADNLRGILTAAQWAEMRRINVDHTDDGICASHDYCDSNMPMGAAFESVMGWEPCTLPDPENEGQRVFCSDVETPESEAAQERDCALWNRAWDIAKARHLTLKPGRRDARLLASIRSQIETHFSTDG